MVDTYTYTARHEQDPEKVITFTMKGEYLEINITGMLENIGKVLAEEESKRALKEQISVQAKPTALKVMEELSGPIHVSDVKGDMIGKEGDRLKLKVWKRVGGLRAAPIHLSFGRVDNPDAARAFVAELEDRREAADHLGRFFGPLDYWLGWLGLAVALVLLWRWPRRS